MASLIEETTNQTEPQQIKPNVGERGQPENPRTNLSELSREPTNSVHIWRRTRAISLEGECSHHCGNPALIMLFQRFCTLLIEKTNCCFQVKCCKPTCEVVDARELLMCSSCLDRAFTSHYSMINATWYDSWNTWPQLFKRWIALSTW